MLLDSRTKGTWTRIFGLALCAVLAGCGMKTMPWLDDAVDGGDTDTTTDTGPSSLDLLLVIDDSQSMNQEQAELATDLFAFVGSLANPLPTSSYDAIDDIRVAVVTSNLGFSSNGVNNDASWPWTVPPECQAFGDYGRFQTIEVSSIALANDSVECDETAAQCPPGWTCQGLGGGGVGVCHTNGSTTIGCPSQTAPWMESTPDDPDPNLAARAACLSMQGTGGCGFEQQLASAVVALGRDDQDDFLRDESMLALVVVSDEEDCSMEDGAALFAESEIQEYDGLKVNLACGAHPEHLFSLAHLHEEILSFKEPDEVFFAAIVGVPFGGQDGASACQGFGDELDGCLEQDEMQLHAEELGGDVWYYRPACARSVGEVEVTRASPGRRYVELANERFGEMSYVCSICDEDWSPAFETISAKIAEMVR
ncbi:MAG: hypothetical protein M0R80_10505 [Proteobacteria bacterium]|jgi:hypothetical protein|nr:hypothetical protein [Pseudomonadota bacterium]